MWRQQEVELGPGATGYCITRSWLHPRKAPGAAGTFTRSRCKGTKSQAEVLPRRDVLNFRFLSPENISYPRGRLKAARGGKGVLGAGFSIASEGGDTLPDRLVGGTRHLLCSLVLSSAAPHWLAGCFPPALLLPALSALTSAAGKAAMRWRERAKRPLSPGPQSCQG